ncbi:hypothetical protein [Photobacterium sp. GB-72]|uniref:hypothetical protein n=1 Tax=Photobacterium sp. GB-72 TaxID=2022105 RepID=UPI000D17A5B4|nr:hypothetical protein [Photobacterium sp. GB-72]PSV28078.1 hypothetical protein C9J40_19555 [Photobacterium sp. GB-72]
MNEKEYLKSLGLKSIDDAYEAVKQHCFTTIENPTKGDVQLVLAACVVNNLDPRFNEIYAGYDSFNQVIPVLKIRGWERLADQSNRIKGIEFIYSDNTVNVHDSLKGCEWVECHVYVDSNDHPITSRVWLLERLDLGHSWLTMPNMRLEQSAYTAAVRRALGVRGLHDIDETTLADVMQMGKPSIEDTSEDKGLVHLVTEEPEPETPTVDQEAIDRLNAKLQMMELELQAIEPETVEYFNARAEIAKVKVSLTTLTCNNAPRQTAPDFSEPEPAPYPEDDELSNNDALAVEEQAPPKAKVIPYKPSQKDKNLLNQYCMYLQSSGLTAIVDRVNDSPELTKPGQREWLISQLTEKAAELNAA